MREAQLPVAKKDGVVELPAHPTEKEFEEYIAAYLQCAGFYVERNIVERDVTEVLELDIITTDYDASPPNVRLVEIKSGGWGFPDVFKVYGWLRYLGIPSGALVVKKAKGAASEHGFYVEKAKTLQIDLAAVDPLDKAGAALSDLLDGKSVDSTDQSLWRFSYWTERNIVKRLIGKKKTVQNVRRFHAMDEYLFAVSSGVFFTQGAVNRADQLYTAFKKYPRISAKSAHEEMGNDFDDDVDTIDNSIFKSTFYECEYTDIQISLYIEHRARLVILKNAIDHLLYEKAGEGAKAGARTEKVFGMDFPSAPKSFLNGLEEVATHKYFHRYPVFWQWFMWLFGGFILLDYEEKEYEKLSARTGIPSDEIPLALSSYDILFPHTEGWFRDEPKSNIRVMKMFPVPFMGVGANLRKRLYTEEGKYESLELTGQYTMGDLKKWNNLCVDVLSQK
jgi:hypothetical protein